MHTFYIYDKVTGEYLGKRETSVAYPVWQSDVEPVRETAIPSDIKKNFIKNPDSFNRRKGKFTELAKRERDKIKKTLLIDRKEK